MRRILFILALAMPFALQAEEKNDTTFVVNGKKIVVNTDNEKTNVQVFDSEDNKLTKSYETEFVDGQEIERIYIGSPFIPKPKNNNFESTLPFFIIGMSGMTEGTFTGDHSNIKTKNNRSWEMGIIPVDMAIPLNKSNTLGIIAGLQLRMAYIHLRRTGVMNGTNEITPYEGPKLKKNYLKYSSYSIPVMLDFQEQEGKHNYFLGIGLSVEWRPSLKSKYIIGMEHDGHITKTSKLPLNRWGLNLEYHIGYRNFQLYMRAALTPLYRLKDGTGAYPFSIGLGIDL